MRNTDLELFNSLDGPTRDLVLRLLGRDGGPTGADYAELQGHPNGDMLASWLLEFQWRDDDE